MLIKRGLYLFVLILLSFSAFSFSFDGTFTFSNTPPEIIRPVSLPSIVIGESDEFVRFVFATDPDLINGGDVLTFYINNTDFFTSFSTIDTTDDEIKAAEMVITPTINDVGWHWFNISVVDLYDAMDSEIIGLLIKFNNHVPQLDSFYPEDEEVNLNEGSSQYFNISWYDEDLPDYDRITVKWILDGLDVLVVNDLFVGGKQEYTYRPDYSSQGEHNLTAVVIDNSLDTNSTYWKIIVKDVVNSGGSSGGGPGGGGGCNPRWNCTDWSPCPVYEQQYRTCTDENRCNSLKNKPLEVQSCTFIKTPGCFDGIKNQDELGVDCGGVCRVCETCNDKILNQGEEDVDCGGPCPRQCGQLAYLYPVCGDNYCSGTDIFICYNDCKSNWGYIGIIALLIAFYFFYGSRKINKYFKKFLAFEKKKQAKKEKEAPVVKTVKDIENIRKEIIDGLDIKKGYFKFSEVLREFFSEYFLINYEFTYQDLDKELKARKVDKNIIKKIGYIFDTLDSVEYGKYKLTKEALYNLMDRSTFVINEVTKVRVKLSHKKGIIGGAIESLRYSRSKDKDYMSKIIFELKSAIRQGDNKKAQELYKEARSTYQKLDKKSKEKYGKELLKLYTQVKSRLG